MTWWVRRHRHPPRVAELAQAQAEREAAHERLRKAVTGPISEARQVERELREARTRNHLGEQAEIALRARP